MKTEFPELGITHEMFMEKLERLKALSNKTRLLTVKALYAAQYVPDFAGGLSFSELMEITNSKSQTLSSHLNILKKAGLIDNTYRKRPWSRDRSIYFITDIGKRITILYDKTNWLDYAILLTKKLLDNNYD